MTLPVLNIRNLHKHHGLQPILSGVDLVVHPGEVVCLLGPSGSGKSTLLSCVNGLELFESGEISVCGEPVGWGPSRGGVRQRRSEREMTLLRRRIGLVFQQYNLFPHLSALGNIIEAPIHVLGLSRADAQARGHALLAKVGLAHKADAYPRQLSGGQQQRVAIARALAMAPDLLLLDEVTSALDPELVGEVLLVLRQLAAEGMTMLMVTHEIGFARSVADRVAILDGGQIIEQGAASAVLNNPRQARTRAFLARTTPTSMES